MEFEESLKNYLTQSEITSLMSSLNEQSKHAVLLNTNKIDEKTFLSLFPNVTKHPLVKNAFLYDKAEYDLGKTVLHELGAFYLQEPSAMIVTSLLNPDELDTVLDLCAAPGGKTIQASFLMNNKGLIMANDLSPARSKLILDNVERLGLKNILITSNNLSSFSHQYKESFTKIILDAPCSGSGMFRKDNKMRDDWSYNKVLKFQEVQKDLILLAYSFLKCGGDLVYSTCSFSKEEDEDVIKYLLDNTDAESINIPDNPLLYKSKDKLGVHIFPNLFPGEGHYICLIHKPGILKKHDEFLINKYKRNNKNYISNNYLKTSNLYIVRDGLEVGEEIGKDIKYSLQYARTLLQFDNEIEINKEQLQSYLKGNVLNIPSKKGPILIKYLGLSVDMAKSDGKVIKNHYPKYRRIFNYF